MIIQGKKYKQKLTFLGFLKSLIMTIAAMTVWAIGAAIGLGVLFLVFKTAPIGKNIMRFQEYVLKYPFVAVSAMSFFSIATLLLYCSRRVRFFRKKNKGRYLERRKIPWIHGMNAMIVSIGLFSALQLAWMYLDPVKNIAVLRSFPSHEKIFVEATKNSPIFMIVSLILLLPVMQELLIRGCVMAEMRIGSPMFLSILLASILSGALGVHPTLMAGYLIVGICFSIIYRTLKNFPLMVLVNIVFHGAVVGKYFLLDMLKPYAFYIQLGGVLLTGLGCISFLYLLRYKKYSDTLLHRIRIAPKQ